MAGGKSHWQAIKIAALLFCGAGIFYRFFGVVYQCRCRRRAASFRRRNRTKHSRTRAVISAPAAITKRVPVATYAVGDIHGCLDLLRRLLDVAGFDGARDRLWLVGDVVNRGKQSLATLRWLHQNRAMITLVLGNHDIHLLAANAGAIKPKPDDTINEILRAEDGDELCNWLRTMPLAHYENDYLMVHAGVLPMWDADRVMRLAAEASAAINGKRPINKMPR